MKQINEQSNDIRIKDHSTDGIIVNGQGKLFVLPTNDHSSIVDDEQRNENDYDYSDEHVEPFTTWPDKGPHNEPE